VPELPDVAVYVERLAAFTVGRPLVALEVRSPFLLRSVGVPPADVAGRAVTEVRRIGKRIVIAFEGDRYAVLHLMIAGRLRWRGPGRPIRGKLVQAVFTFSHGLLHFTEAGTQRKASLHLVHGESALAAFDRGGLEVLPSSAAEFAARLRAENHTLKRALTDPRILSGIGNAYSDEILHRARLSPLQRTTRLTDDAMAVLHDATRAVLEEWIARTRAEVGEGFPEEVTAFREGMAVHGRHGQPCPVCRDPVQRIRYADNETNYCVTCQTGGRLLADRGLSRLLGKDWPRSLEELEELPRRQPGG
jgi:formamidopyrimidine-DNA glycosylase